jgi:hypothetical protein
MTVFWEKQSQQSQKEKTETEGKVHPQEEWALQVWSGVGVMICTSWSMRTGLVHRLRQWKGNYWLFRDQGDRLQLSLCWLQKFFDLVFLKFRPSLLFL